jgi:hypothetical protein
MKQILPAMRPRWPAAALLACLVLLASGRLVAQEPALELDAQRVGWSAVQLTGSRLFLSVDAHVRLQRRPLVAVAHTLLAVPSGHPVEPGGEVMEVTYRTRAVNQQSEIVLLMDPWSGAALQRIQHDSQGRLRQRTYRYGAEGAFLLTRWPADGEEALPPGDWSEVEEGFRPYPAALAGQLVSEPTGLFYLIAASALAAPGDRAEFLVYSRRNMHRVMILVTEPRRISTDFDRLRGDQRSRQRGSLSAPRLLIRGETLDEDDDDEFELLGLRGDLELYLDPGSRAPLQLSGNVKLLGRVTLRARIIEMN